MHWWLCPFPPDRLCVGVEDQRWQKVTSVGCLCVEGQQEGRGAGRFLYRTWS